MQRITQRTIGSGVMANLQGSLARSQRLQEQLSSGKRVNKPSDSPTDTVSALRYRADIRRSEQLSRNASDGIGWLGTADSALTASLSVITRARSLVLSGANATAGPNEREAMAVEVEGLRESLLSLANTTYLGRPVFGGTVASTSAYDASGAYVGDAGVLTRTIAPGVGVEVSLPGTIAFGPADADVFRVLADIAGDLRTAPTELATTDLTALDAAFGRVQNALSTVGARYAQVETMRDRTEGSLVELRNGLGEVESIDLPQTIMEVQMQEVAYKAALAAGAKVLQPSLVDFLR